jgi:ATP/maltotriose-dependent transcriptional regulator MalT
MCGTCKDGYNCSMSTPILATKVYIPPPRPKVILRPRLNERLNEGLHRKLTLISAPAGFGKTTLVNAWVAARTEDRGLRTETVTSSLSPQSSALSTRVAWLSLDNADNDPTRFLTYFVVALQTIAPTIGAGVLGVLQSPQPPPTEAMLTALLNDITTIPDHFVLVLDDYHVIDATPVDLALAFLLEHLPPQMHLVITTREDPQLPLARLRVRDQMTELRAADLRFTPTEAAAFLSQVMDLDLSTADVAALESRTEGWIAGLQLAALSMRGRDDIAQFVRAFAGDNHYIVDYLVDEVLQRQPERVRSYLLQTAILDRLSGPLCDAVTGQAEGNARLEALERGNFFVVPLDDTRHWYRYHHLFAEVLAAHLRAEQPDQVAPLHRRASAWYEQHGSAADAIRHAQAAEDFERAADLIELAIPEMRRRKQGATMLGWLKALPDELIRFRPVLSAGYAWALLAGGELEAVEARLQDAERWLDTSFDMRERLQARSAEMVVVDEAEFRRLPGAIAVFRAAHAQALGDVPETMKYARRALDLVPEDDHLWRGAAQALMGLASWTSGDLETAYQTYANGTARVKMAWNLADAISNAIALADIRIAQGRLHEAMSIYEQSLQLATEQGESVQGIADLYVVMSELHREHNDLDAAMQHLLKSKELVERTGIPENRYRWCVTMARLREAQGDLEGALDLLNEAERLYVRDFSPNVRPVAALKTRVRVAQGRLGEALGWVREQGLSVDDDLSYLREFKHLTLARVLLARSKSDRTDRSMHGAVGLLERLLKAAEERGRTGSVIEILVVQALAHQAHDDIPAALVPLQQALTLAEPEGYVRMFVDEGPPMAQLLREAAARRIMPDYTGKLLAACEAEQQRSAGESPLPTSPAAQPLIEPLSQRELAVLRLFTTELSGPEIAQELVVALSTVRTHTKSIYSKLNVNSRRAAVKRAAELDLL